MLACFARHLLPDLHHSQTLPVPVPGVEERRHKHLHRTSLPPLLLPASALVGPPEDAPAMANTMPLGEFPVRHLQSKPCRAMSPDSRPSNCANTVAREDKH